MRVLPKRNVSPHPIMLRCARSCCYTEISPDPRWLSAIRGDCGSQYSRLPRVNNAGFTQSPASSGFADPPILDDSEQYLRAREAEAM
jgi:hypothetical protein